MKYLIKFLTATALIAGLFSILPIVGTAEAGLAAGDYERAKICRQMRNSGTLEWYSIAGGTLITGSGRSGYSGFITKACHTTRSSCQRWVQRIWHEIPNLDTFDANYCKRVR